MIGVISLHPWSVYSTARINRSAIILLLLLRAGDLENTVNSENVPYIRVRRLEKAFVDCTAVYSVGGDVNRQVRIVCRQRAVVDWVVLATIAVAFVLRAERPDDLLDPRNVIVFASQVDAVSVTDVLKTRRFCNRIITKKCGFGLFGDQTICRQFMLLEVDHCMIDII